MKDAARPNLSREGYIRKSKEALSKLQSLKENFENREKKTRADLEKARKIWEKLGERFRWWQSLL
ncbi:MAG: hypothetical protein CVV39_02060 [Planctomycetes bacterium HGW-Planctomycetes-1]|nr:MAG: hypothetical protein CVV39_02060 [Planctomycetes bacterium HGW-Planctomycetes-1]